MTTKCFLTINIDATGALTGTIDIRSIPGVATGTFTSQNNVVAAHVHAVAQDPLFPTSDIDAQLHGTQFIGTATSNGQTGFATMDVSAAGALNATFDIDLVVNPSGAVTGSGMASSCNVQIPINVTGTNGPTSCALHFVGANLPQFVWDGSGPRTATGFTAAWTGNGFGASALGSNLAIVAPAVTPGPTPTATPTATPPPTPPPTATPTPTPTVMPTPTPTPTPTPAGGPNLQTDKQQALDDLRALRSTARKADQAELDDAIKHVTASLKPNLWLNQNHLPSKGGTRVFDEEKDAAKRLLELINDKKSAIDKSLAQADSDRLVNVDRQLAQIAIGEAIQRGGDAKEIAAAQIEFARGESDRLAGKPDTAIEHYKNAWSHAVSA